MEPGLGPGVQAMLVTERTINEMAEKGGGHTRTELFPSIGMEQTCPIPGFWPFLNMSHGVFGITI